MTLREDILSSLSFFSIIPLKKEHYSENALNFMFVPFMLSGLISAFIAYLILPFLPIFMVAILSLFIIILIHGAQNADGLMDFGDGIMKRGSWQERLKAMKDTSTGTGAIISVLFTYLLTIGALYYDIGQLGVLTIFYGQLMAIIFMANLFFRNSTIGEGFASYFKKVSGGSTFIVLNLIFPLFLSIYLFPQFNLVTVLCILFSLGMRVYVGKIFKGVNGDILGASGEIGRMFSLILIMVPVLLINFHF